MRSPVNLWPHENTYESTCGSRLGATLRNDAGDAGGDGTGRLYGPGDLGSTSSSNTAATTGAG